MKSYQLAICLSCFLAVSCTSGNQDKKVKNQDVKTGNQEVTTKYHFSVPEIPAMISSREGQANFLAEHFWDNLNFRDSLDPELGKVIEEAFIEYLMIIREVEPGIAARSIASLMTRAGENGKLATLFIESAEKLLYHPNSPIRSEFMYEEFLKGILASRTIESIKKERFRYQYGMAQKNKPGTKAADIKYTFRDGSQKSLYQTPGELIMIYFHNPGCHECASTIERIVSSQVINRLENQDRLKILAIYPDEDLELWEKHYSDIPETWIHAYDKETIIQDQELYDLRAIPTIYLLDADKNVLLRDPVFEELEKFLGSV